MSRFVTEKVGAILPYVPGEQPQGKKYIKLNTNENPYFVSKYGVDKIDEKLLRNLKLYSDPEAKALTHALAEEYGVQENCVLVTNGSDEALAFIFKAFFEGNRIAYSDITYGFYSVYSALFGAKSKVVKLKEDFTQDFKAFDEFDGHIVLANPNAQTGLLESVNDIEKLLKKDRLVVVDEAYADFSGSSVKGLLNKYDNLLLVGTFSKSRSLAGARLGFVIGDKELIDDVKKVKYSFNPYNVNSVTQSLGESALKDKEYFSDCLKKVISTRENTKKRLGDYGFEFLDGKSNFILAKNNAIGGEELYTALKEKGVLVRHFSDERIADYVRITIGTDEEMDALFNAVDEIIKEKTE